jgi:adenosylhomocysteine nucleosidase
VIGIIVPLFQEAAVFNVKKNAAKHPVKISENLLLFVSGVGEKNAVNAVNIMAPKVTHLISWGTAAGLSEILKPGDLLLPDLILDKKEMTYSTDTIFNEWLIHSLPNKLFFERGLLCESADILTSKEDKKALHIKSNGIACDMESATIARLAQQKGIPFNALRVITDDYQTSIPKSVYLSMNEKGEFSTLKFLVNIVLNPLEIGQVNQLAKNFARAKETMQILKEILMNY